MPVTGAKAVRANMRRVFKDISDKKAPQFVNTVISIGVNHSKELTPIEYSNLINSIVTNVTNTPIGTVGSVTYMANYAAALEFGKWKPRPLNKKKGPATNMNAKPHFLKRGFEDPESQALIKKAADIFKV